MTLPAKASPRKRPSKIQLGRWGEPRVLEGEGVPSELSEMEKPPERAYLWGELPPNPWVSIVGTRSPTRSGRRAAFSLARRLARAGVTIASGGALGIDTAAHLGALAEGRPTIVLAPTWLPRAYPVENHPLFHQILKQGGAYLTVSSEGAPPFPLSFFRRNEALMALSHATVLGECGFKSGAKNAMKHARRLARARFALPFRFGDARAEGLLDEILKHGAELIGDEQPILRLLSEFGDFQNDGDGVGVLERRETGPAQHPSQTARKERRSAQLAGAERRSPNERSVFAAVFKGETTIDAICAAVHLAPSEVQHAIVLLTLSGDVIEDEQGLFRVSK